MAKPDKSVQLSRRERQIMEALYELGKGTAAEIREALIDPPSYTTVRTLLGILRQKGHVTFMEDGPRYIYEPVVPRQDMAKTSLLGVVKTFFGGSVERAVMSLIEPDQGDLSKEELERISQMIEKARREGR